MSTKPKGRKGLAWSKDEDAVLVANPFVVPESLMDRLPGRSAASIASRLRYLRSRKQIAPYTPPEPAKAEPVDDGFAGPLTRELGIRHRIRATVRATGTTTLAIIPVSLPDVPSLRATEDERSSSFSFHAPAPRQVPTRLMDAHTLQCRVPVDLTDIGGGGRDLLVCGKPVMDGKSFCRACADRVTQGLRLACAA